MTPRRTLPAVLTSACDLGPGPQVRAPLLLVPQSMGPLVVLVSTLFGYAGEFSGPLVAGFIKDTFAPHCAIVDDGNGTRALDPLCTSDADQRGLLYVLVAVQALTIGAGVLWISGGLASSRAGSRALAGDADEPAAETELL